MDVISEALHASIKSIRALRKAVEKVDSLLFLFSEILDLCQIAEKRVDG
jgi:hypothetical protein